MSKTLGLFIRATETPGNFREELRDRNSRIFLSFVTVVLLLCISTQGAWAQPPACAGDVDGHLKGLGISLPAASAPVANYVPTVRTGNLVFLAGTASKDLAGNLITGKVGADLTTDQGYQAAWSTGIYLLSALKAEIGDLNKVTRVVKVFGMVNADPTFTAHPTVINGISDLLVAVFGDCGRHARTAVGMGSLPFGIAVEIDMVVEVADAAPLFFGPPTLTSIIHQDFSGAVNVSKPAQSGEIIHLYGSGFGPVSPAVAGSTAAPASPLSRTVNPLTCGAMDASGNMLPLEVLFAGLAPGQTGVYQLDVQLLGTLPAGNIVQVRCGVGSNYGSITVAVH